MASVFNVGQSTTFSTRSLIIPTDLCAVSLNAHNNHFELELLNDGVFPETAITLLSQNSLRSYLWIQISRNQKGDYGPST